MFILIETSGREVCRGDAARIADYCDALVVAECRARNAAPVKPASVAACVLLDPARHHASGEGVYPPDQTTDEADVLSNLFGPAVPLPPEGDTDDLAPALVTTR